MMPPIATTIRMPIISRMELRSSVEWLNTARLLCCYRLSRRKSIRAANIAARRAPQIVGHDQYATEVERAAERTDDVVGMHRLDGLDEGVFEEAVLVVGAPHQALHDAADPHRGD